MGMKQIEGSPIIDAKQAAQLIIEANDIEKAHREEPEDCVVARACRRIFHAIEARVHLNKIYIRMKENGPWTRFETPRALRSEIIAWDRGGKFVAGEFRLAVPYRPVNGQRQGGKQGFRSSRMRAKAKPRTPPHIVQDVRTGPAVG